MNLQPLARVVPARDHRRRRQPLAGVVPADDRGRRLGRWRRRRAAEPLAESYQLVTVDVAAAGAVATAADAAVLGGGQLPLMRW